MKSGKGSSSKKYGPDSLYHAHVKLTANRLREYGYRAKDSVRKRRDSLGKYIVANSRPLSGVAPTYSELLRKNTLSVARRLNILWIFVRNDPSKQKLAKAYRSDALWAFGEYAKFKPRSLKRAKAKRHVRHKQIYSIRE